MDPDIHLRPVPNPLAYTFSLSRKTRLRFESWACFYCEWRCSTCRVKLGFNMSNRVLRRLPCSNSAGVMPVVLWGVVLYAIKTLANRSSIVPWFLSSDLSLRFVRPFQPAHLWQGAWYGAEDMCLMPLFVRNISNSSLTKLDKAHYQWQVFPVDQTEKPKF